MTASYLPGFIPSAADQYYNEIIAKMQARIDQPPSSTSETPDPQAAWYEDSTGCFNLSLDVANIERTALENGHQINYLYATPQPAAVAAPEVAVKALEWSETSYGTPEVQTVAGVYRLNRAGCGGWSVNVKSEVLRDSDGRTNFATLEKAKAAAQSDYEQRIRSALSISRSDPAPEKAAALMAENERLPAICDGKEQYAFEAWAKSKGFDMHEHPLHYLFMDTKTDAARQAWKAAIQYCSSAICPDHGEAGE
ncbi:hypothetical protein G6L00_06235 [Agrobacterium rhizogenes]|nr:hypothetical protein [Rhizobium rhizogenes]